MLHVLPMLSRKFIHLSQTIQAFDITPCCQLDRVDKTLLLKNHSPVLLDMEKQSLDSMRLFIPAGCLSSCKRILCWQLGPKSCKAAVNALK